MLWNGAWVGGRPIINSSRFDGLAIRASHGFRNGFHPALAEFLPESCHDLFRQHRPFVDEAGVKLDQARARRDFFPRIFHRENAADTDDGHPAL